MTVNELIATLTQLKVNDMQEVVIQLDNCCRHGHEIKTIELGKESYKNVNTSDELSLIVIRGS